nr:hypothetical protein [Rhizobium leguminosarum]
MDKLHAVTGATGGRLAERVARPGRRLDVVLRKRALSRWRDSFPVRAGQARSGAGAAAAAA